MKLLTVIVNYRTAALVEKGLDALLPQLEALDGDARAVVVDNASGDGSLEHLQDAVARHGWESRVSVVDAGHNGGFAFGNNVGIRPALGAIEPPDYIFLLNPDAVPDPGCVAALVGFLEGHAEAGIVGPRIHGGDGRARPTAFRFPGFWSEVEGALRLGPLTRLLEAHVVAPPPPTEPTRVDWLSGACMLFRREVFESVGLFDETFFLYFEEIDLCLRAREGGWAAYYVPEAGVEHMASVATGLADREKRTPPYWFASRRHYFLKHHGPAYLAAVNLAHAAGFGAFRLRRRLQKKPDTDRAHALWDFVRHNLRPPARDQLK